MMCRSDLATLVNVALWFALSVGMSAAVAESQTLDDLSFMTGSWSGRSGSVEMEEIWTLPKGGVMLGLHRDVALGKPAFFEFLRIEDRDGEMIYVASPRGAGTTEFSLKTLAENHAVFENLEHDFPQRIIYRRDDDRLTARVEGEVDGKFESTQWTWVLAG